MKKFFTLLAVLLVFLATAWFGRPFLEREINANFHPTKQQLLELLSTDQKYETLRLDLSEMIECYGGDEDNSVLNDTRAVPTIRLNFSRESGMRQYSYTDEGVADENKRFYCYIEFNPHAHD